MKKLICALTLLLSLQSYTVTGIVMAHENVQVTYTQDDFLNFQRNNNEGDDYWKFFYSYKLDLENFAEAACFFGNVGNMEDLFLNMFNSRIEQSGSEIDTVQTIEVQPDLIKFQILDTRNAEEFGKQKSFILNRCTFELLS